MYGTCRSTFTVIKEEHVICNITLLLFLSGTTILDAVLLNTEMLQKFCNLVFSLYL
jgi:hypothetical protein